jgi:predicted Zn-dependent protease
MSAEPELELARRAIELLEGEQVQATVIRERSLFARFARSAPTQSTAIDDTTVVLLCVRDGHTGAATTNRLDGEGLQTAADHAIGAAQAAARSGPGDYPGLPSPAPARANHGHDAATAELDPAVAAAALSAAFATCAARGVEAFGIWTAGEVRTALVSSTGVERADAVTDAHVKVIARDAAGRSGYATATAVSSGAIDAAATAAAAAAKVDQREPGPPLVPGEHHVVLDHAAVGTLLEFLGDLAFNGLAHAEGRGALSGRLGERVAAPTVNLSDSPRVPGTLPRTFDAEGVPKRPLPLIEDGVAHAVVHDIRSAARAGAVTTGHALAPGGATGGPAPTNLVLAGGGAATLAELCAPIERGIYVTRLWYVNAVDPRHALLTGMTRDGTFLIEDGEITRPLRDVRFTDSALRILAATEELTAAQRLVGEAELYGRRFATGVLCPALRARDFRITGAAAV